GQRLPGCRRWGWPVLLAGCEQQGERYGDGRGGDGRRATVSGPAVLHRASISQSVPWSPPMTAATLDLLRVAAGRVGEFVEADREAQGGEIAERCQLRLIAVGDAAGVDQHDRRQAAPSLGGAPDHAVKIHMNEGDLRRHIAETCEEALGVAMHGDT